MAGNNVKLLKQGEVLFSQGEVPRELYMLQSGSLEILSAPSEFDQLDKSIIISKSRRVGVIKGKTILSGFSNLFVDPYKKSIRAIEDSQIAMYPLKNGGFKGIAASDPSQAASILRQLFNRLNITMSDFEKITRLYQNVSRVIDNISIIYKNLPGGVVSDNLDSKADVLNKKFSSNGGNLPQQINAKFLISDNSKFLNKKYEVPGGQNEWLKKQDYCNFIKKILMLEVNLIVPIIKANPAIAVSMFEVLSSIFRGVLDKIESIYGYLDRELTDMLGENSSWSSFLVDGGGFSEWKSSGKIDAEFVKNFLTVMVKINTVYEEVSGQKLSEIYPGIKNIHQYYTAKKEAPAVKTAAASAAEPAVSSAGAVEVVKGMKRSLNQLFEFALIDKEFQGRFIRLLNDFKSSKNPFSTDSDGRKIRRHLSKMYWDLYKQVFIRNRTESTTPRPVKLMLSYGFLDEGLLEDKQLVELNDLARMRETSQGIPIYFEHEFLTKIHNGEITPSITEMGLTYEAHLRELEKHSRKKKEEKIESGDENTNKTIFEIEQRLASTAAVCSGSTATSFPILTSHLARGSLKSIYVSKQKIEGLVNTFREIDFSLFSRETVLKLGEAREIIQEEVIPYIIILPVFGTKTLLWQDLVGTDKRSLGRLVVPTFFLGDIKRNFAHTLACFRWELNRSVRGPQWADPIDGGLTGEYFDYVNTFKKNNKLSAETKLKIKEKFKSLRTNRDRFADDYITWVLYERDGIMKLNNHVREMLFKYIPFRKPIRERLEGMPAFSKYANRYKNVQTKSVQAYQRRYKKYQDAQGNYPEEIKKFFDFLGN